MLKKYYRGVIRDVFWGRGAVFFVTIPFGIKTACLQYDRKNNKSLLFGYLNIETRGRNVRLLYVLLFFNRPTVKSNRFSQFILRLLDGHYGWSRRIACPPSICPYPDRALMPPRSALRFLYGFLRPPLFPTAEWVAISNCAAGLGPFPFGQSGSVDATGQSQFHITSSNIVLLTRASRCSSSDRRILSRVFSFLGLLFPRPPPGTMQLSIYNTIRWRPKWNK